MDKSRIITNKVDREGKPLKGLLNAGVVTLDCSSCRKPLLCLQRTSTEDSDEVDVVTSICVKCEMCGGNSSVESVHGSFYPGSPNDNMAFDVADSFNGIEADVFFRAWEK